MWFPAATSFTSEKTKSLANAEIKKVIGKKKNREQQATLNFNSIDRMLKQADRAYLTQSMCMPAKDSHRMNESYMS